MISDAGSGFGVFLLVLGAGHSLGGAGDPSSCSWGLPSPRGPHHPSWRGHIQAPRTAPGPCGAGPGRSAQSCSHWAQGQARGGPPGSLQAGARLGTPGAGLGFGEPQRGAAVGPSWAEEGPERAGVCSGGVLSASEAEAERGQLSWSKEPPVSRAPQPSLALPHRPGTPSVPVPPGLRARFGLGALCEVGMLERMPCLTGAGGLLRGPWSPGCREDLGSGRARPLRHRHLGLQAPLQMC